MSFAEILFVVVTISIAVFTRFGIHYLRTRITDDQKIMISAAVKTFVYAAEQLNKTGAIAIPKKEWVLQQLEDWMAKNHIHVDLQWLDSLIESIVCEINLEKKAI